MYEIINKHLTQREKQIIIMRYGLFNTKPLTQMQIAKKLGISRSYISRIESKALATLSKHKDKIG